MSDPQYPPPLPYVDRACEHGHVDACQPCFWAAYQRATNVRRWYVCQLGAERNGLRGLPPHPWWPVTTTWSDAFNLDGVDVCDLTTYVLRKRFDAAMRLVPWEKL